MDLPEKTWAGILWEGFYPCRAGSSLPTADPCLIVAPRPSQTAASARIWENAAKVTLSRLMHVRDGYFTISTSTS